MGDCNNIALRSATQIAEQDRVALEPSVMDDKRTSSTTSTNAGSTDSDVTATGRCGRKYSGSYDFNTLMISFAVLPATKRVDK